MKTPLVQMLGISAMLTLAPMAQAQRLPEAGYVFPAGGKAGTTVEVKLGGYDWTPDMEFFVLDQRVKLIPAGPPGPLLMSPPPYWFGAKGRIVSQPIPREVSAKLVIPADVAPGPIYWQAANANGCSSPRAFIVGAGPEVVEDDNRQGPQALASLPMTVSGRLFKNEEIDRYKFQAGKDGPITCELMARRLGAKFLALMEVRDAEGRVVADVAGASGSDPSLTFAAKAGAEYVVSVHDLDFGGDRSHVYRLTVTPGPRVVGAMLPAGRAGETREVEFFGIGVATGAAKLESVKRQVAFPATGKGFDYRLETPWGAAPPYRMLVSDVPEIRSGEPRVIVPPVAVTGVLDEGDAEDGYWCAWKKGEVWSLAVQARAFGSPLDVALTVYGPGGKEMARNDDLPETTDAGLDFTVPADGTYRIVITDMAGKSGSRSAIYRLVVRQQPRDYTLHLTSPRVSVPVGTKFDLPVKAIRTGGFKGPINLTIRGLPAGVTAPPNLIIPADKIDLAIPLQATADASCAASLVTIEGSAMVPADVPGLDKNAKPPEKLHTRQATVKATVNLAPSGADDNQLGAILVASTMKPRFKGRPVDQDTGRKVHRGSTFPAEVTVERLEGFQGEIILQMAATQSYQMQGISGGDVKVPPGVTQTIYPCYMPEWLETIRTSRMGMIAVAQVPDPKGKVRWLTNDITGFITMTLEGALLKLSSDDIDLKVPAGQPFDLNLKVARLTKLAEPVRLELQLPPELAGKLKAEPIVVPVGKEAAVFRVTPVAALTGLHTFSIRATALQDGKYPAISEPQITVEVLPAVPAP